MNTKDNKMLLALTVSVLLAVGVVGLTQVVFTNDGSSGPGQIDITANQTIETDSNFQFVGHVDFTLGTSIVSDGTFEEVRLCMYHSNGSVLDSRDLGTFQTPRTSVGIDLDMDTVPRYMVVHHPRFNDIRGLDNEVQMYHASEHTFGPEFVSVLPFNYSDMDSPRCGPY